MAFTDPPYNVSLGDHGGQQRGQRRRRIENDALSDAEWLTFCRGWARNLLTYTDGALYICMSCKEWPTVSTILSEAGGHWSTTVIWSKDRFVLGRADYQRQYEPILYGWKDGVDHYWCGARDQGDVWFIDKPAKNDLHPTMKPIELVERAIRNSSKSRDIVLDLFGGSGTTTIAAERAGRRARLVELDPKYVDVIVQRWQNLTGCRATHATTGQSFENSPRT
jgi:DNA modification methylase